MEPYFFQTAKVTTYLLFQVNSAIVPTKTLSDPNELEQTLLSNSFQHQTNGAAAAAAVGGAAGVSGGVATNGGFTFDPGVGVANTSGQPHPFNDPFQVRLLLFLR